MATSEDLYKNIGTLIKEPDRDFSVNPLTQPEVMAIVETLVQEVNDPKTEEAAAQYFIECIEFLKTKILYN